MVPLRSFDGAVDRNGHICDVTGRDREHVEGVVRWNEDLSITFCEISGYYCIYESLLVRLLSNQRVIVSNSAKVSYIMHGKRAHRHQKE